MNPPEIISVQNFIAKPNELLDSLVKSIHWDLRMKSRETASFGIAYNYSGIFYPEVSMHPELLPISFHLEEKFGYQPNNCLINLYKDGSSTMGFHSDSVKELYPNTGITIISLGETRTLRFKNKTDKAISYDYSLENGSLFHMSSELQEHWLHAIPKSETNHLRMSLTFRKIKEFS